MFCDLTEAHCEGHPMESEYRKGTNNVNRRHELPSGDAPFSAFRPLIRRHSHAIAIAIAIA
jgi:hypothetical protein